MKIVKSKPLSDSEATELGADMIAEIMIWSAAALQVVGVYYWQQTDKDKKSEQLNARFENIQNSYDELKYKFDILDKKLSNIQDYLAVHSMDDTINEEEYKNLIDIDNQ